MASSIKNIMWNNGGGDEQYTPEDGVKIILPYIQHLKNKIFWCPFDTKKSEFVKVLREAGFKVVFSHLSMGGGYDFFTYEPKEWDVILSNPPYKNKRLYLTRCMQLGKPWCFLLPINILSDALINQVFGLGNGRDLGLLIPENRMKFNTKNEEAKNRNKINFKACYFGYKFFKEQIILEGRIAV